MERFEDIARKVTLGDRITEDDALYLFTDFHDLTALGQLAEARNYALNQDVVYYNINRHINPTNICALSCKFCAYSRKPNEPGAYAYSIETMVEKAGEAVRQGATEVHMVGGLHPRWNFDHYVNMIRCVKEAYPQLHIKAFTAVELDWLARKSRQTIAEVLQIMHGVGLGSLPGGGAEIFHPDVRDQICDTKVSAEQWLKTHQTAHELGMHSNATMLYGHIETPFHRVDHMSRLRTLQDQTRGFNAFIPLAFQPFQNEMGIDRYTLGTDDLKTLAIARIFLDNFKHIKAYWIMLGQDIAQIGLNFGANDLDGTVIEEKISRMAGGRSGMAMSRTLIKNLIQRAGRLPVERDTLYRPLDSLTRTTVSPNPEGDQARANQITRDLEQTWESDANGGLTPPLSAQIRTLADIASPHMLAQLGQKKRTLGKTKNSSQGISSAPQLAIALGRTLRLQCPPIGQITADGLPDQESPGATTPFVVKSSRTTEASSHKELEEELIEVSREALTEWHKNSGWNGEELPQADIYIDLSGLCDHIGLVRAAFLNHFGLLLSHLSSLGRPIHLLALKTLWRLCHPTREPEQELLELVKQFKSWGIVSIQSSPTESETDLTSSEVAMLHRAIRQGGLSSVGKLEIVAPSVEGSVLSGESRPLWEPLLKRAEVLGQLVAGEFGLRGVRIEVAPGCFVTPVDYLKGLSLARLALPVSVPLIAPFLSLPTLGLTHGEGSKSHQHPAEKMAALVASFGAQSLGVIDGSQVSPRVLGELLSSSGVEVLFQEENQKMSQNDWGFYRIKQQPSTPSKDINISQSL